MEGATLKIIKFLIFAFNLCVFVSRSAFVVYLSLCTVKISVYARIFLASFPYFNGTGSVYVCIRVSRRNNEARAHVYSNEDSRASLFHTIFLKGSLLQQQAFEKCWAHSPLRAAVTLPFTRCRYCRTPAIAIAQAACDVHDNDNA